MIIAISRRGARTGTAPDKLQSTQSCARALVDGESGVGGQVPNRPLRRCTVCTSLTAADLAELNAVLADPAQWAPALIADWKVPTGAMPAHIREWGGIAVCKDWCAIHGYPQVSPSAARWHFTRHVVHIARTADDTHEAGKMGTGADNRLTILPAVRPRMFIDYYAAGLQLGIYALDALRKQIEEADKSGAKVPEKTLWRLAELGAKLAMSQATMWARGVRDESEDVGAGFREGSAPLPSQRFGNSRIREIEGERRPVVDRGRTDRRAYNARAIRQGGPKLPE